MFQGGGPIKLGLSRGRAARRSGGGRRGLLGQYDARGGREQECRRPGDALHTVPLTRTNLTRKPPIRWRRNTAPGRTIIVRAKVLKEFIDARPSRGKCPK